MLLWSKYCAFLCNYCLSWTSKHTVPGMIELEKIWREMMEVDERCREITYCGEIFRDLQSGK